MEPMELILTAKAAENQYVGVSCGNLDQSCEVLSKRNHLLYLDEVIYNYCKYYMVRKEKTANIDKDQSISGFSRSLSLYFFLLGVVLFVLEVFQIENKNLIVVILLMGYRFHLMQFTISETVIRKTYWNS